MNDKRGWGTTEWSALDDDEKLEWVEHVRQRDDELGLGRFTVSELLEYRELLEKRISRQQRIDTLEEQIEQLREQLADAQEWLTKEREGATEATVFVDTDFHSFEVAFRFVVARGSLHTVPRELAFDPVFPVKLTFFCH